MGDSKRSRLKEYVDLKSLNRIQGILSDSVNQAICTTDLEGNEVLLTGKLPYFSELLKTTDYGSEMIKNDRQQAVKKLLNDPEKVLLYFSTDGLLNIWVPIIVEGSCCGAIGIVSLLDSVNKNMNFSEITRNTNFELEELREAVNKIKPVSQEEIRMYSSMLFAVSKTAPELLRQKYLSDKKNSELTAIYNLTKMVNSTLKIEDIVTYILKFLAENFNVNNCSVIFYDKDLVKSRFYYLKDEKLTGVEDMLISESLNTKTIIKVKDISSDFRYNKINDKPKTKSILCFPLKIKNEMIGILNLYLDDIGLLGEEKQEFISVAADQLSMAVFNAREFQEAKESAMIDKLTNLFNRRYFVDLLKEELIKNIEKDKPLSVAMLDIDDFKQYNDTNGHIKGDSLLKDISNILKNEVRRADIVGRYGGEEFIAIFPDMNNDMALSILDRIRKKVEDTDFFGKEKQPKGKITISAGLVTCLDKAITYDELIEMVDKTLYKSKLNGKNMVTSLVIVDKNLPPVDVNEVNGFHNGGN